MKINWGSGIAIFYSLFVLVMVFMVVKSTQNKTHLVQENYYNKDLNYESFRKKRENAKALKKPVTIKYRAKENTVQLAFPSDMASATGKVTLFRPSNKYLDKSYTIDLDEKSKMDIPLEKHMPGGLWKVQVDWEAQGEKYYTEENLVF